MPRQTDAKTQAPGSFPTTGTPIVFTACDTTNFDQFVLGFRDLLMVWNTDASPHSITITSVPDPQNRSGDIVDSIPANTVYCYGPFIATGWQQSNGTIFLTGASALLKIAVVSIP